MDPRHRVVIITGASAGIGAATARLFAAAGAKLVLAARSREPLERLAAALPGAVAVPTDVGNQEQCRALVELARTHHGRVDILINNAGVGLTGPVVELSSDDLERALAVNLLGPLWLMQAVAPLMRAQGRGQIINVSTVLAEQPLPYLGGYAAAKAALERLSETLRMELRGAGVRVTVVRPGSTRTEFRARRLGAGREQRRLAPPAVPPETAARAILRAARREPLRAYVTFGDHMAIWLARLLPGPVEALLSRAITWEPVTGPALPQPDAPPARGRGREGPG
ncbi:MAG: SDR family NAD(P)-dependent oxidoreductase [Chloroflexaceae bacterium]